MTEQIVIRGAREHNLKNVDLDIPRNQLVVITGLSGSGKSSLAFDTIYAEGQRRYMESLSAYARQFLGMMERPDVDFIDGLSPVIAIEQKTVSRNPRSTVGTVTEIYDFLRLLFARVSTAYSHVSGGLMRKQSDDEIIDGIMGLAENTRVVLLAPLVKGRKGHYRELFEQIEKQGFQRVRIDGEVVEIEKGAKLDRYKTHDIEVVIDRLVIKPGIRTRVAQSVETALGMGGGTVIAQIIAQNIAQNIPQNIEATEEISDRIFSRHLFCPEDGVSYDDPSPNTFSFNSPYGACPECNGLGSKKELDPDLIIPDRSKSIQTGAILPLGLPRDIWIFSQVQAVADAFGFSFDTPTSDLTENQFRVLIEGAGEQQFDIIYKYKDREVTYKHRFSGVNGHVLHTYESTASNTSRKWAEAYMRHRDCQVCGGGRLRPESLAFKLGGRSIADLTRMDLRSLKTFLDELELTERQTIIGGPIIKEIRERLVFMLNVGVGYLNLDRSARTLSGGESQRIRLATQIGTQLTGVLYVLDEPSIGLHARDNAQLIASLKHLRDLENSVLVVEHDREMIEAADFLIDLGPGAGEFGGKVVSAEESLTTAYLNGTRSIAVPATRRSGSGAKITLKGAKGHNLKGNDIVLPVGTFICVTGVSGSGKSSLINQTLYPILAEHFHNALTVPLRYDSIEGLEHIDKVIDMDQSPIGRTPRSNPATYAGLFNHIRDLFAQLPESKIRGYKPGRFSFNVKGGRCESCKGAGIVKLEMNFLPDVYVACETCNSKRYNAETLEVQFKGKNIADVLEMTVEESLTFFEHIPKIERKLRTLHSVGLGYIRLGQQATTISGGEAQRVKLAKELSRPGTGKTLYILDEPTTGLHFEDIRHLLAVLQALVRKGNTVLVIEHNMDVIKVADYVVDLGPDGGNEGGYILFSGTPEQLAVSGTSTGDYLAEELARILHDVTEVEQEIDLDALTSDDDDDEEDMDDPDDDSNDDTQEPGNEREAIETQLKS